MSEYRFLAFRPGSTFRRREPWKAMLLIAALPFITGFAETGSQPLAPELCKFVVAENIGVNAYPSIPESLGKYENACELHAINGIRFADASYAYLCDLTVSPSEEFVHLAETDPERVMKETHISQQQLDAHKEEASYKKSLAVLDAFGIDFVNDTLQRKATFISGSSHWGREYFSVLLLLDKESKPVRILKTIEGLYAEKVTLASVDAAILWGRMHLAIPDNVCDIRYTNTKNGWILENVPLNDRCTPTGTKTLAIGFDGKLKR